jgi:hypothetical protein
LVKDYDVGINYHPGKANVVVDALSRKQAAVNALMEGMHPSLQEEFVKLNLVLCGPMTPSTLEIVPTLMKEIQEAQKLDEEIRKIKDLIQQGKDKTFHEDEQGTVWFKKRICVPDQHNLRQ